MSSARLARAYAVVVVVGASRQLFLADSPKIVFCSPIISNAHVLVSNNVIFVNKSHGVILLQGFSRGAMDEI